MSQHRLEKQQSLSEEARPRLGESRRQTWEGMVAGSFSAGWLGAVRSQVEKDHMLCVDWMVTKEFTLVGGAEAVLQPVRGTWKQARG